MIRVYFKANANLIRVEVDTASPGFAQVQAHMAAASQGVQPETPMFAVIQGGRAV